GREARRRCDQRDRMRDGERGDDRDERTNATERNDETEDEQQVIDSVENVLEAEHDEAERRLIPVWVEAHEPGIPDLLQRTHRAAGGKKAQQRAGTHAESRERGVDRKARGGRGDRVLEHDVEHRLLPREVDRVGQRWTDDMLERAIVALERAV